MKSTQILAELLIIGVISLFTLEGFGINIFTDSPSFPRYHPFILSTVFISISYAVGYFINLFSEMLFAPLHKGYDHYWVNKNIDPSTDLTEIRYDLYAHAPEQIIKRLDYHRSFLRLSRCVGLYALIFLFICIYKTNLMAIPLFFCLSILSILSYIRRTKWYNKTIYQSWRSLNKDNYHKKTIQGDEKTLTNKDILVFSGGTAFREINRKLVSKCNNITRVVPIFDNGGSSQIIRKELNILPVGDIRHALITMAPHDGEIRNIVRLFNWRLPIDDSDLKVKKEFDEIINGDHELISNLEGNLRGIISGYLNFFYKNVINTKNSFKLQNGSIGNFILVGAYYAHNKDMNAAIYVFRQLAKIKGDVLPVSLKNNAHLIAEVDNHKEPIVGQDKITKINRNKYTGRIKNIFITDSLETNSFPQNNLECNSNPLVIERIRKADIIIYGPGSFFTSILPHFMINNIVDEIHKRDNIKKIFIANIMESFETYEYTISELIKILNTTIKKNSKQQYELSSIITHIFVNNNIGDDYLYDRKSERRYLPLGNESINILKQIKIEKLDLEDPWNKGYHDPEFVANRIIEELNNKKG